MHLNFSLNDYINLNTLNFNNIFASFGFRMNDSNPS